LEIEQNRNSIGVKNLKLVIESLDLSLKYKFLISNQEISRKERTLKLKDLMLTQKNILFNLLIVLKAIGN